MKEGFSKSLFGFRRENVLSYIEKLSAQYADRLREKDEEIAALRKENETLKQTLLQQKNEAEE